MAPDSDREREIFGEALELGSLEERLAFVKGACGSDAALRHAVEALLESYSRAGGFIPDRLAGCDDAPGASAATEALGSSSVATNSLRRSAKAAAGWSMWPSNRNRCGGGWR
jgi:hypothetical protein